MSVHAPYIVYRPWEPDILPPKGEFHEEFPFLTFHWILLLEEGYEVIDPDWMKQWTRDNPLLDLPPPGNSIRITVQDSDPGACYFQVNTHLQLHTYDDEQAGYRINLKAIGVFHLDPHKVSEEGYPFLRSYYAAEWMLWSLRIRVAEKTAPFPLGSYWVGLERFRGLENYYQEKP